MNAIKAQLARIQGQLALLTPSQKLLAMSLVAVLLLTVMYWGRYAATADRVAISDRPLGTAQTAQLVRQMQAQGIEATVDGGLIKVPADAQVQAVGLMAFEGGQDSTEAIDKIMSQATLWDSAAKTATIQNEKKQALLSQMIRSWPGVAGATVLIDPSEKRSLSGAGTQPRATISISMKDKQPASQKLVQAAAQAVAGAQAGLPLGNIMVTVNGQPQRVDDPSDPAVMGASTYLEQRKAQEMETERKVTGILSNIPNVLVRAAVDINTVSSIEKKTTVDPKNVIQKETETQEKTTENNQSSAGGVDPGTTANTGTSLGAGGSPGQTMSNTTSDQQTKFAVTWGHSEMESTRPPGEVTVRGVAVRIPKSYFVRLARAQLALTAKKDAAAAEPDEAAIEKAKAAEVKTIVDSVVSVTNITDPARVVVSDYLEVEPETTVAAAQGVPVISLVNGYGKEVALGVLALAAMAMVSGIVRKSGAGVPAAVSAAAAIGAAAKDAGQSGGIDRLAGGHEIVGAATEGGAALEALELDEETGQTQQMVNQVSTMVKENPDAATALIKRWMARE